MVEIQSGFILLKLHQLPKYEVSSQLKPSNRVRKCRPIIPRPNNPFPIPHNHPLRPNRTQRINHQPARLPLNTKHLALTNLVIIIRRARRVIVIEETVQSRAVNNRVARVEQAQAQRVAVSGQAVRKIGVIESGVGFVGAVGGVGVGLVIGGFGLDEADEDGVGVR